jgi:hypothetical protein
VKTGLPMRSAACLALKHDLSLLTCQAGGRQSALYQLGAALPNPFERELVHGQCVPGSPSSLAAFSFFELGTPTDPGELPPLKIGLLGTGRIRAYAWHNQAEQALGYVTPVNAQPLLFDSELDVPCSPITVGDEVVCAPPMASVVYGDDRCEEPLLEVYEADACPLAAPMVFSSRDSLEYTCGEPGSHASVEVYRAGAPTAAPATRHIRFEGGCFEASSPLIFGRYLELGEELPATRLARLELLTEQGRRRR